MAVVDLIQRSDEWFAWRKTGITASMIPVIMGLSPYQTPYQLWAEFVGLKEPDDLSNNWHVQRGVEQEPEARDAIEKEYGRPYMPVCVEADHNPLFKASLDGLYALAGDKEVLEIKCPHEKIYQEILSLKGQAPTFQMYAAQVQWQLNCSGANKGRLFFYLRKHRPINIGIRRNDAFIAKAEKAAIEFWNMVKTNTPPALIEGRDKTVYDQPVKDNTWLAKVEQYKEKAKRLADIESKAKAIKADLKQLESYFTEQVPDDVQTFDKDGIRATRVDRTGNIDYSKLLTAIENELNVVIPETMIEKHRKEGTSYFKVTVTEEKTDSVSTEQQNDGSAAPETAAAASTVQPEQQEQPKAEPELISPKQLAPGELDSVVASKEEEAKPVENPVPVAEPEMVHPLPASNFFEKTSQSMFF
jgi:putative phage-type endonuclease